MKYYKVEFGIEPMSEEACDVLSALLADEGFETFVPMERGLEAYIQQQLYNEEAVKALADNFLMPDVSITFTCEEAPDEDWNETWEAEGFEPIVIDRLVCVHDTHHPAPTRCETSSSTHAWLSVQAHIPLHNRYCDSYARCRWRECA